MTAAAFDPLARIQPDRFLDRRYLWKVFRAFNFYRLILVALLLTAFALDEQNRLFGKNNPLLFLGTALTYMVLVLVSIAGSYWRRPVLKVQAHLQMLVDLTALTVLIHASGGLASSLNILLVTAIAASSILLPLSSALLSAALGFFLLAGSWLIGQWHTARVLARAGRLAGNGFDNLLTLISGSFDDLARLGILGVSLFIAAGLTYTLAERARSGEALVRQRTRALLEVAEINQAIIRHLQDGVIVVDRNGQARLMNDTARELLEHPVFTANTPLAELSPPLQQRLQAWLAGSVEVPAFRVSAHRPDLIPRFTRLSGNQAMSVLILLEDSEQVAERLQQIKLAALGRLTAGIAHEIRNPLTSISHAAQLLQEPESASPAQQRLSRIIYDNVKRANRIITEVLDLARRDRIQPEQFILRPWLENFALELRHGQDGPAPELQVEVMPANLCITFDPGQLRQVLWNLCANACQHGCGSDGIPCIELRAGVDAARPRPFLEVRDAGPGVPAEHVTKLFEPFFTTRSRGTGLGLYIARELCEANRAQLQYWPIPQGGSCFRITLAPLTHTPETDSWTSATL